MKKTLTNVNQSNNAIDFYSTDNDFINKIVLKNVIACNNINKKDLDLKKIKQESKQALTALGVQNSLQAMLASQMLAIHYLQQDTVALAKVTTHPKNAKYLTNAAAKLSNTFVQQANLLSKLQGNSNQKMVVEHVHIHNGAQAIVGNIQGVDRGGK